MDDSTRWQFADTYNVNGRSETERHNSLKSHITTLVALLFALGGVVAFSSAASSTATMAAYSVPTTVARDCSHDVTAVLNNVIAKLADNSKLTFPPNGCYQVDGTITISGKRGLTVDAGNSSFRAMTNGSELPPKQARTRDQFLIQNSTNVTITNAIAYGDNPHAGLSESAYVPAYEAQHGFEISSSSFVTLDHVQAFNVYGDFAYIGGGTTPSRYVAIRNSTFRANGRIGMTIANATDVFIYNNSLDQMRRSVFDLEPYAAKWVIERVTILGNVIGPSRLNFLSNYGTCAVVEDIRVVNNRLVGQELNGEVINQTGCSIRRHTFVFAGNVSDKAIGTPSGMALKFVGVDGISLTNNVVPLQAGRNMRLARLTNSTFAAATGNVLPDGVGSIFTNDGSNAYCASNNRIGDLHTIEPSPKPCGQLPSQIQALRQAGLLAP
jgi:hypothetical protein